MLVPGDLHWSDNERQLSVSVYYSGAEKFLGQSRTHNAKRVFASHPPTFSFLPSSTTMASEKRSFLGEITSNRGFSCELDPGQIGAVLSALAEGKSPTQIHRETSITRSTIYRKKNEWLHEGKISPKPRSGRPRYFNDRSIRQLKLFILRDGCSTYSDI